MSREEIRGCPEGPQPALVAQEAVHLVREDKGFDMNSLRAELLDDVGGLDKQNIAIVIAVHEQDR